MVGFLKLKNHEGTQISDLVLAGTRQLSPRHRLAINAGDLGFSSNRALKSFNAAACCLLLKSFVDWSAALEGRPRFATGLLAVSAGRSAILYTSSIFCYITVPIQVVSGRRLSS